MACTVVEFKELFPEFSKVLEGQVQACLDLAYLEIDQEVWGAKADSGQYYLAAHKLCLSPFGQQARLSAPGKKTTYEIHYDSLVTQVACGYRVIE